MRALVLRRPCELEENPRPLELVELPDPVPGEGEILIRVSACGVCDFCRRGDENLCPEFRATGRDVNGGYAEYITVREEFAYRIPEIFSDSEAAPLLCAGAIG